MSASRSPPSSRETRAQALDAAELLDVDYEALPARDRWPRREAEDAPQLHEAAPGNVCFRLARGDEAPCARRFDERRACRRGSTSSTTG